MSKPEPPSRIPAPQPASSTPLATGLAPFPAISGPEPPETNWIGSPTPLHPATGSGPQTITPERSSAALATTAPLAVRRPPRRALRGIPSSRAYWELKADQMMNRVFSPEPTIDVEDDGQAEPRISPRPSILLLQGRPGGAVSGGTERRRSGSSPPSIVLFSALGGVCMVSALSTMVVLNHWNRAQESLQQERNLLLVERLRQLGPAIPAPVPPHASELHGAGPLSSSAGMGPAASVQEAWIEELDQLPPPPPAEAPPLSVPVSTRLAAPAPVATASPAPAPLATSGSPKAAPTPAAPAPLLVGVVGAPGKASSAIFQYGNVSTSVDVGQVIGSSGWVLRAADGDTAVIERAGESRRISIGNGG